MGVVGGELPQDAGAPEGNRNATKQSAQNEQVDSTADQIAKQHGVSRATVVRDGQFAAAVEKLKEVAPEIEARAVAGTAPPKGAIVEAKSKRNDFALKSGSLLGGVLP